VRIRAACYRELRRISLPRRSVNKGKKEGLSILPRPSWVIGTYWNLLPRLASLR